MKLRSLSYKIISRILLFSVALGLILVSFNYYFTRTSIEESTRTNAALLVSHSISKIEEAIRPAEKIPENLAWIMETGAISKDSIYSFLEQVVKNNPTIYGSAIAFEPYLYKEGQKYGSPYAYRIGDRVETTNLGSESYNYFIMDWYQIPAVLKQPYWSEPYYDEGGGNILMSTYSVPFYLSSEGKRIFGGIITIDISLSWLTDIVNSVKILDTGYAFLVSRFGRFVTHRNKDYIMNETIFTLAKELDKPDIREIGRTIIHGESGMASTVLPVDGKVWIYYTQMASTNWSLGVVYPNSEMYASLRKLNVLLVLIGVIGISLLIFFTIRIINQLVSPLTRFSHSARIIAEGNFHVELPVEQGTTEMKELHDSFEFMQKELANYIINLKETTTAKEKIESELRIAKEIQMGMIPHTFPPFPDLSEIDLFASLESAREVGGDLYDFFLVDDTRLCFAIGDVSGKGVPASLFMAVTRTLLRSVANKNMNTADIVGSMNKTLSMNNESNMFVTFLIGILDVESGELAYCNAGHNPPVMIRGGQEAEFFQLTKSIPVGIFEAFNYEEDKTRMHPGDQIFLYTDGLTEAEDKDHRLFGDDHLLEFLRKNAQSQPEQLIKKTISEVERHVKGHPQSDDLTLLSITFKGKHGKA